MNILCVGIGSLFIVSGILFANGKLLTFVRGWETMTKEEKEAIQIEKLYRNIGLMITSSGVIFVFNGISSMFSKQGFMIAIMVWLLVATFDLMYIEKSKRYQGKS